MARRAKALRLLVSLALLLALPSSAPAAAPRRAKQQAPSQEERQRELLEARQKAIEQKVNTLTRLIREVNEDLESPSSAAPVFERKRALESQLRDLITRFSLTDRAIVEAGRLALEAQRIRRNALVGPPDPRRLQLANFLEARRVEYLLLATR